MKATFKRLLFQLLGKDPDAAVVSFATGEEAAVRAMVAEARQLMPDRKHVLIGVGSCPQVDGVECITLTPGGTLSLYFQLRSKLGRHRIGMAPVLFTKDTRHHPLRRAAFFTAPTKILAYNQHLERHHLQFKTCISSLLFFSGVRLDRIHLRPRWLPGPTPERTSVPDDATLTKARAPRRGHRRIAVLTPFFPYPLSHGGAVRLFYLLRELAVEFDVYLFAFLETEALPDIGPLAEFCSAIATVSKPRYREPRWSTLAPPEVEEYESAPMRHLLARVRAECNIELLQVEYTQLARYDGDILVEHDVTFDLYQQLHDQHGTLSSWWDRYRWRRFERAAISRYQRVITMSEKDARLLGTPNAVIIGNGVDLKRFRPVPEYNGYRLLFIGSFRHFPNVMAYRFLIEEVWPKLAGHGATLTVVAGPDPELYAGSIPVPPGVRLLSFVADVRPLYEDANIVLVPTLVSAGTNVKVLEAMAMERAIVSTPSGVGGIPVEHRQHVWIAEGGEAFADGIRQLAYDPGLRDRMARRSREVVEQFFDWSRLGQMQRDVVRELLPERIFIRPGVLADLSAVRLIQAEALPTSRWDPGNYMEHEFYVGICEGVIAGFVVARRTAPDEREILNLATSGAFRRLGIGQRLLQKVIQSGDIGYVFLEVRESNWDARRLYERIGFEDVGRRPKYYDDPVETAVIMRVPTPPGHASFQNSSASERRT